MTKAYCLKSPVCRCGRGKQSHYDGKCGHCRTKKEQKEYEEKHARGGYRIVEVDVIEPKGDV
jgi:hypothetical protein